MRTEHKLSESTRQQISKGMKRFHSNRTEAEKERARERQSRSMTAYWETIPDGKPIDSCTNSSKPCRNDVIPPQKQ